MRCCQIIDWLKFETRPVPCEFWNGLLAKGAVSCLSKKQATVALSTAEAKYVALSAAIT